MTNSEVRIKWQTCGPDRRDRVGNWKGYEVRIVRVHSTPRYRIEFYQEKYGSYEYTDEGLEQAKADANRLIPGWVEARKLQMEQQKTQAQEAQRFYAAKQARLEAAIVALREVGVTAVDGFGFIALTVEDAEMLAVRLSTSKRTDVN
jgi:hypothetical protein